jgi:hypothetical protein
MPDYVYTDEDGHTVALTHRMDDCDNFTIVCACGLDMARKPSWEGMVNYGGIRPSQGEYHPEVQELLATQGERRAEFEKRHEEHEKRTANDDTS